MIAPRGPPGLAFISRMPVWQPSMTPVRLMPITRFQVARSMSSIEWPQTTPALLNMTSSRPCRASTAVAATAQSGAWATSRWTYSPPTSCATRPPRSS